MPDRYSRVSLLITHYNRSASLRRLLLALEGLQLCFAEIIVSDDGSGEEHLDALEKLKLDFGFTLITTPENRGLGNNINKGQAAVKTDLVLYIQEDFVPEPQFLHVLRDSVSILERYKDIDLIRFFGVYDFPYTRPFEADPDFQEMFIPSFATKYLKIYMYSDTPHLRRRSFVERFGHYRENINGDRMEYWMCVSFIQQKGRALMHKEYRKLFDHYNTHSEPSMIPRAKWRQQNVLPLSLLRSLYRQVRYNFDLMFRRGKV